MTASSRFRSSIIAIGAAAALSIAAAAPVAAGPNPQVGAVGTLAMQTVQQRYAPDGVTLIKAAVKFSAVGQSLCPVGLTPLAPKSRVWVLEPGYNVTASGPLVPGPDGTTWHRATSVKVTIVNPQLPPMPTPAGQTALGAAVMAVGSELSGQCSGPGGVISGPWVPLPPTSAFGFPVTDPIPGTASNVGLITSIAPVQVTAIGSPLDVPSPGWGVVKFRIDGCIGCP